MHYTYRITLYIQINTFTAIIYSLTLIHFLHSIFTALLSLSMEEKLRVPNGIYMNSTWSGDSLKFIIIITIFCVASRFKEIGWSSY